MAPKTPKPEDLSDELPEAIEVEIAFEEAPVVNIGSTRPEVDEFHGVGGAYTLDKNGQRVKEGTAK